MGNGTGRGQRVLALGIEGMSESVLEPLVAEGVVPTLAELLSAGVAEPLAPEPRATPERTAASLATGTSPGKHGIVGSLRRDGTPVDATDVRERTLWELLDDHGVSSVVIDAPLTNPPASIAGAILSAGPSGKPTCYPPELLEEHEAEFGEYRTTPPTAATREERVAGFQQLAAMRGRAFRSLAEQFDPGFGYLHFSQPAAVTTAFPGDTDALRDVYAAVDEAVERVLDAWTPGVVVVVSGYGIEPTTGYEFRVNDFLREQGHLVATVAEPVDPPESDVEPQQSGFLRQLLAGMRAAVGLGASDSSTAETVDAPAPVVDQDASAAYAVDATGVYLDDGLDAEAAARLRAALVTAFQGVETPDGDPVFSRVARREDVFAGTAVDRTPDVVLEPAAGVTLSTAIDGATFGPKTTLAVPTAPGVLGVAGRLINAEADCTGATLLDVAPTVLSALDVPWSDRMDGTPLPVVEPTVAAAYPMGGKPARTTAVPSDRRLADPSSAE